MADIQDNSAPNTPAPAGRDAARAAAIEGLRAMRTQEAAPVVEDTTAATPEAPPAGEDTSEIDPVETEHAEDTDDSEPADEPAEEASADPVLAKRLARIKAEEKRSRDTIKAQLAEAETRLSTEKQRLEAEWKPRIEAAEKYEQAAKRAKYDPVSALLALGVADSELEDVARTIYLAAKGDPNSRTGSRFRETEDEISQLRRKVEEMEAGRAQERTAAENARQAEQYLSSVSRAVGDAHPLVAAQLEKAPAKAMDALATLAAELVQETGEIPEPADLLAEYESRRRAELEELGIDVGSMKQTPTPAKKKQPATLTKSLTTTTTPTRTTPQTREERRAAAVAGLRKLRAGN